MAWPSTPLTTYVANSTPAIKSFDLNAMQGGTNGIINGTYSLHSLVLDGAGGAVVAGTAGTATLSASASGAAVPHTAVPWGKGYKESLLFGSARVDSAGTVIGGFNVITEPGVLGGANHAVVGEYLVFFNGAPTNVGRSNGCVIPFSTPDVSTYIDGVSIVAGNLRVTVRVRTIGAAPAAVDGGFMLLIFGG